MNETVKMKSITIKIYYLAHVLKCIKKYHNSFRKFQIYKMSDYQDSVQTGANIENNLTVNNTLHISAQHTHGTP